jgi:K+-transporting ATPase A subunit
MWQGWFQISLFAALIIATAKPLGGYIVRSLEGQGSVARTLAPVENGFPGYHRHSAMD